MDFQDDHDLQRVLDEMEELLKTGSCEEMHRCCAVVDDHLQQAAQQPSEAAALRAEVTALKARVAELELEKANILATSLSAFGVLRRGATLVYGHVRT